MVIKPEADLQRRQRQQARSCRILAPAMASTGTTSTQKYQYSQPTTKPGAIPKPARANSVKERTCGSGGRHLPQHAHHQQNQQPADGVADEARGAGGNDGGAAADEHPAPMIPPIEIMVRWRPFERAAEFVRVGGRGRGTSVAGSAVVVFT